MKDEGLMRLACRGTAHEVWERLLGALDAKGVPVFCTVDHAANAEAAGMHMPFARVVTFGNPAVGTLLMLEAPVMALDLPLRMLVHQTAHGVELCYTLPEAVAVRHGLAPSFEVVGKVAAFLSGVADSVRG